MSGCGQTDSFLDLPRKKKSELRSEIDPSLSTHPVTCQCCPKAVPYIPVPGPTSDWTISHFLPVAASR